MPDINCYIKSVGLASCACPCQQDGAPTGWNESDSGLFIADLMPLDALPGMDDCSTPGNPWAVLSRAREQAINNFIADTNALLARRAKPVRPNWFGSVGEGFAREVRTPSGAYAGLRLRCPQVRGAAITIEKVGGVFDTTGNVTLRLYDRYNAQIGSAVTIAAVAGQHIQMPAGWVLPLDGAFGAQPEFFIAYQVGPLPRATKINCGCGGFSAPFNCASPYYNNRALTGSNGWAQWAMIGGWTGEGLTSFDLAAAQSTTDTWTNGLTLTLRAQCDPGKVLCEDSLNFANPLALSMAHAIRYKSAEIGADTILTDTSLSRYAVINREILREERKKWQGRYVELINYITSEADWRGSDCFTCKSVFDMQVAGILS